MVDNEKDDLIHLHGHVAKMPKNTKAASAYNFLERIKVSKQKLWYILIEKQDNELQMIKYNNRKGFDLKMFLDELKVYYSHNELLKEHIENLEIDGSSAFSIIKNIPNVEINGKKLITILVEDLIKLLR